MSVLERLEQRQQTLRAGFFGAMLFLTATIAGAQTLLIDTGAGAANTLGSSSLFSAGSTTCSPQPACAAHFQFLAARITLTQATALDHVELWLGSGSGGQVAVHIRSVNPAKNGLPGEVSPPYLGATSIYQQTYTVPGSGLAPNWYTFSSFVPILAAGTYWLTFEPVSGSGFNRTPPKGVSTPLERYAFFGDGNPGYLDLLPLTQAFGIRVWGTNFPGLTFGTGTRSLMVGNPSASFDTTTGGEGQALNYHWIIDLSGYGYTFDIGKLTSGLEDNSIQNLNGLSAGAHATTCWSLYHPSCAINGARGVAYRTFKNTGSSAKTIKIKTLLEGAFYTGGRAAAFVYVLDPTGFTNQIVASGVGSAEYLLRRDGLAELSNANSTLSLASLFPGMSLATPASAFPGFLDGVFQTIPMQTGQFTVNAGAYFTLLFDVSAYSSNGGTAGFGDTLKPAADFITDALGNPVPEIMAVGPSAPVSKAAASIVLTPPSASTPVGEIYTVTATVKDSNGIPVANKLVKFHIVSGPGTGNPGIVVTDANGQAAVSYSSPVSGTDQINATVNSITSNTVSSTWTVPGLLDHLTINPANASIVVGGSQAYTATGYDKFDNLIGDITATTTFSISPNGSCTGATCTASVPGPHTVTGTNGSLTAHAGLSVTSGSQDTVGPITSNVLIAQNPVAVNVATSLGATVSDATTGGSTVAAAQYNIDGGSLSPTLLTPASAITTQASATLPAFSQAGVFNVCVRGQDSAGNTGDAACLLLPVYDPSEGFVTGGGEVASPAGADLQNGSAAGAATFGFVSKYLPGRNTPSGNLEFKFKEGDLAFKSINMDWLVVTGQPRAIFRGMGTINGTNVCKFEVDAWDGSFAGNSDAFGLKIFSCASGGDRYNLPAQALSKGSIIIHK